jgi:hypothetical protein
VEIIDKVIENYKDNEQVLAYIANKANELIIEQKNKEIQDILVYL